MKKHSKKPKPNKPYPGFPLYAHACGQWAKKVRGKLYYFGKWDDREGAINAWLRVREELMAGHQPAVWDPELLTTKECLNLALSAKKRMYLAEEIDEKTYHDYKTVGEEILKVFEREKAAKMLRPHDFQRLRESLGKDRSIVTLRNLIRRARVLFNWCHKNGYLDSPGKLWGTEFSVPAARLLRIEKNENGPKLIPAERIRQLIAAAPDQMKAMIFLGINCAYGPADCGMLCWENLELASGWATLPRNKTGKTRRAKLWPETIAALGDEGIGLVFRTRYGNPWLPSALCHEFQKLRVEGESIGFYWLRHTFLTIAEETKDFEAARVVMGHVDASITGQYRSGVSDERLESVSEYVRNWLQLQQPESEPASEPHVQE